MEHLSAPVRELAIIIMKKAVIAVMVRRVKSLAARAGCGGCHGGCGTPEPIMEGKNVGKKCRTHYKGTFNDGTQFDSSYDRGEPLEFICGVGQMIRGFDQAVANMEVGESVEIHLMPEEAYGMPDPAAIFNT